MKRTVFMVGLIVCVLATCKCASTKAEPQVVTINVIPRPTPRPQYIVDDDIPQYQLNQADVKRIARLLWSSPLRSESEKVKLVWLVLNRADHGDPFGDSIETVITKKEFSYYDRKARVSDTNREIVEKTMNLWMAEKDGHRIGARPPKNALYARFGGENNRQVELLDEDRKVIAW